MLPETLVNLNTLFTHPQSAFIMSFCPSPKTQLKNYLAYKLDVVSHAFNPGTGKVKAGKPETQG